MQFSGLHHVAIIASDYPRSKHFYTEVLGLPVIAEVYREAEQSEPHQHIETTTAWRRLKETSLRNLRQQIVLCMRLLAPIGVGGSRRRASC